MNLRLVHCPACRTAYMVEEDAARRPPPCPKCGAAWRPPAPGTKGPEVSPEPTVFVPSTPGRPRRGRKIAAAVAAALVVVAVAAVVSWPMLKRRWITPPSDPIESAASAYLRALVAGDSETAHRLGTVDLPPAIRSFRQVRRDPMGDRRLRGSFAPIAAFHAKVDETYAYDPAIGRYTPRNALGPAADVLDALHEAKDKAEKDGLYKKMQSGNPDDLFDAAEGLGKSFTALAEGALAPKKLLPTYAMLLDEAKPPLPPEERALAADFASQRPTWDALLGRPFTTLRADGPFLLERAEVTASVADAFGSSGDPPTPLRLTLTRFRLEGIDTGWRVTSARREGTRSTEAGSAGPSGSVPSESANDRHDGSSLPK